MITLTINNIEIRVTEGTTVLEAAEKAGFSIPTMCYLKELEPFTSCMICMVQDEKNGRLFPSCSMPAAEGMIINTQNAEVVEARKTALELLLSEHVGDCEAPCTMACPAHMDIPAMNRLLAKGQVDAALKVVREDIAMPAVLGYICSAPCEGACKRKPIDEAVSICMLKRFAGEYGAMPVPAAATPTTKNIAIIGGGPTGLAAAYYLQINGFNSTLFHKYAEAGGSLFSSVKEKKLPKEILEKEILFIEHCGVQFQLSKEISKDDFENLVNEYDAVLIAIGSNIEFAEVWGLELSKNGISIRKGTFETSREKVFAAGSATRKAKLAISALAQGKQAAKAIQQYLNGETVIGEYKRFNSRIGKLLEAEYAEYLKESTSAPRSAPKNGEGKGFTLDEVIAEAARCMHCDCRDKEDCKLRNYSDEYKAAQNRFDGEQRRPVTKSLQHDMVVYEPGKCIKCGICVQITAKYKESYGMTFIGRGFDVVVGVPFAKTTREGLEKVAAEVVAACPVGALARREPRRLV